MSNDRLISDESAASPRRVRMKTKQRRKRKAAPGTARFYYKGNRIKQLRAFCYAVKFGTVARAADALFLSASSVSLQLSALEKELGAHLLERTRPRLALTAEGQMLYDLARPLVEGIENLDQQFRTHRQGMDAGQVTIAAGASTIQYLLPPLVRDFREQLPAGAPGTGQCHGQGRAGPAALGPGRFRLRLDARRAARPVLRTSALVRSDADPAARSSAGDPKTDILQLEDLSPYGLILPPQRLTTYRLVDLVFQQRKVPYRVAIEVGGWEVIKQYVAMGLGISIVTGICINESDRARLAVHNLRRYFPQRSYGVVVRKGKYLSPQARAFIDLIKPDMFVRGDYFEAGHSGALTHAALAAASSCRAAVLSPPGLVETRGCAPCPLPGWRWAI